MKYFITNIFKVIMVISLLSSNLCFAQGIGSSSSNFFEVKEPPRASEFIYRSSAKESLIGVQLVGAVKNPGIYYIPPSTDLLKLLALAGGSEDADLSEILVRKVDTEQAGVYELDIKKLMKTSSQVKPFKLSQDDFVYVPRKEPWISNDVSRTITIVSLLATIVLTSVLIQKNAD